MRARRHLGCAALWVALLFGVHAPELCAQQAAQQVADPRLQEAERLFQQGRAAAEARAFDRATRFFEKALQLQEQALGTERADLVPLTDALGAAHRELGNHAAALSYYRRSLAIREKALGPEHPSVATSLTNLAGLYRAMGEYAKALPLVERSLAMREKALGPTHTNVATSLNNLGLLYESMGEYAKALALYQRSLAIYEKALGPEHPSVATSLNNLAALYESMGEYAKALPLYQRSLAIYEKTLGPEHPSAATNLNNLAALYESMGEYAKALPLFQRSLAIREKAFGPEHPDVAQSLNNLAALYESMGEYAKARPLYERSFEIRERALGRGHPDVAHSLNNLAGLYQLMDEYAKALPLYERSVAIREKALGPEHPSVATSLNNLAGLYQSMGEYAKALPPYQRSLAIYEKTLGPEHPSVATSLNNRAGLYESMGEYAKALPLHQRALAIASNANAPEALWRAQDGLRAALARGKQPELAIFFGKEAVNTIQSMRARLTSLNPSLQRSFLRNKENAYRGLADLLIEQGRLPEAQQALAMLKEEEFFDFIRRDARQDPRTTQTGLTAQEEDWQKRYQAVSGRLAALGAELEELRRKARLGLTEAEQKRRAEVEADLKAARLAFDQFLGALMKEVETAGAARAREVGERGLVNLRALQGTLASLGHGVVTLHYLMGEEKLRILLTTPSVQIAREAKIGQKELNRKIEQFRRVLQNPKSKPLPIAQALHQLLIAPVAEDLKQAKAQTLMVSLDGALRYIPLAALHDGQSYLVETYRVAIFTEAAKDKLKDTPQASWRLAGLGLTHEAEGFSPLPAVRQELEGIIRTGDRGVLPGEVHFDQAFTAARVRDVLDKAYPVLHVASHFVFQPGTESNSFLLLGDGNRLTLRELKENDYDFRNVDLITLSACETAVGGGRDANGQEIEGFGALAQKQGARGVIATLWQVADASTGLLMQKLYRLREAEKLTKAEALRRAQLALLRGGQSARSDTAHGAVRVDAQPAAQAAPASSYAHPYFWAPFILMGNWL